MFYFRSYFCYSYVYHGSSIPNLEVIKKHNRPNINEVIAIGKKSRFKNTNVAVSALTQSMPAILYPTIFEAKVLSDSI